MVGALATEISKNKHLFARKSPAAQTSSSESQVNEFQQFTQPPVEQALPAPGAAASGPFYKQPREPAAGLDDSDADSEKAEASSVANPRKRKAGEQMSSSDEDEEDAEKEAKANRDYEQSQENEESISELSEKDSEEEQEDEPSNDAAMSRSSSSASSVRSTSSSTSSSQSQRSDKGGKCPRTELLAALEGNVCIANIINNNGLLLFQAKEREKRSRQRSHQRKNGRCHLPRPKTAA